MNCMMKQAIVCEFMNCYMQVHSHQSLSVQVEITITRFNLLLVISKSLLLLCKTCWLSS